MIDIATAWRAHGNDLNERSRRFGEHHLSVVLIDPHLRLIDHCLELGCLMYTTIAGYGSFSLPLFPHRENATQRRDCMLINHANPQETTLPE